MQDFAYLFRDSVAAWLQGRGDARFQRYEKHYRAQRATAPTPEAFDLERTNIGFARRFSTEHRRFNWPRQSKALTALATFLVLLWGGTVLLSSVGATQPVAVAALLGVVFVGLRLKRARAR